MSALKWVKGYVTCTAECDSWERMMNMCRHHGILLWSVAKKEKLSFCMYAKDFIRLVPFSSKVPLKVHIVERKGLPFLVRNWKKDWTFYSGFLFFFGILFFLSQFVWRIDFVGQSRYTKEMLQETLYDMGVWEGMFRQSLACNEIETNIRERYPEISWVSAEESDCVLKISIKEGQNITSSEKIKTARHLVAKYDGEIKQISVNRGTALVKPGDTVKKGDVLISGIIDITNDANEVIKKEPVEAKGEVSMRVSMDFSYPIPTHYQKKVYSGNEFYVYTFHVNNHLLSVKNPIKQFHKSSKYDILNDICVNRTIYPFSLQIRFDKTYYKEYIWEERIYTREELKEQGSRCYEELLASIESRGEEVCSHHARMKKKNETTWMLNGNVQFVSGLTEPRIVSESETKVENQEEKE